MRALFSILLLLLLEFVFFPKAEVWAQQVTGVIAGRALTTTGEPAADAQITLVEARRRTRVGTDGSFRFTGLGPGEYHLQIQSPRHGVAVEHVQLGPGDVVERDVTLDLLFHAEAITVTVGPGARELAEVVQPVQVLGDRELLAQSEATLGQTLAQEPGVSSTYFGPGASRPVIRGLGGDRIRILESGIGTGDASSTSPDHAVSQDPLSTERIEIVRGPSTLLYGSSAIGGVVNVIDERIPRFATDVPISGSAELRGGSVSDERAGGLSLSGGVGSIAWHAGGLRRDTDDYEIPGFAESARLRAEEKEEEEGEEHEEHEEAFGLIENSSLESTNLTGGLSLVGDSGFAGIAVSGFDTNYGIPGHAHAEEEEEGEEEAAVRIDLEQRRVDFEGELNRPLGFLRGARVRFGTTNYEHVELEGEEIGTTFTNESWEGRLEAPHEVVGGLSGAFGLQALGRDFSAIGEEAFVPPTETRAWAMFAFEELPLSDEVRLQFGARYEHQKVDAEAFGDDPSRSRDFDGFSASTGMVWNPAGAYGGSLSIARSTKLPNAEELYSNGPHLATASFEVGDPDLDAETSLGADLTFRLTEGRVTGQLSLFANRFSDFIHQAFTEDVEDGLPVRVITQDDALFLGGEGQVDVEVFHVEPHHVAIELTGDFVRAELTDTDEPLPQIPPVRLGIGAHYQGQPFWGEIHAQRVLEQDRVADFERPTDGYTTVDATIGWRLFAGPTIHDLILRATNLTNEEARNHVSFLKDLVPLPGRDIRLAYRLSF